MVLPFFLLNITIFQTKLYWGPSMTTRTVKPPLPRKLSIPPRKMITINAWLLVQANLQKMLPDLVDPFWISAMVAFSTCKRSATGNLTTP